MNIEDLRQFRDQVAMPRMMQLFEKTQIPEGTCYIDNLEVSFLDGRSCGYDSSIEASGLSYSDGKVEEYRYSEQDVDLGDFLAAHRDCVFLYDGRLSVTDEIAGIELRTCLGKVQESRKLFFQMEGCEAMRIEDAPIAFEKMRYLLSAQRGKDTDREKPLDDLMREAREKAAGKNAQRSQKCKGRDPDLGR